MRRTVRFAAAALVLLAAAAHAETRYVRDVLLINLRPSPGVGETIALLRTGDAMEILEEQEKFARVRTAGGNEGWVSTQYLTPEPPALLKLQQAEAKLARLTAELAESKRKQGETDAMLADARARIEQEARTSGNMLAKSKTEVSQMAADLKEVRAKYEKLKSISEREVEISEENERLIAENERLAAEATTASKKLGGLEKVAAIKWFLAGAAVLITGWFLGIITGRKRKSRGYTIG